MSMPPESPAAWQEAASRAIAAAHDLDPESRQIPALTAENAGNVVDNEYTSRLLPDIQDGWRSIAAACITYGMPRIRQQHYANGPDSPQLAVISTGMLVVEQTDFREDRTVAPLVRAQLRRTYRGINNFRPFRELQGLCTGAKSPDTAAIITARDLLHEVVASEAATLHVGVYLGASNQRLLDDLSYIRRYRETPFVPSLGRRALNVTFSKPAWHMSGDKTRELAEACMKGETEVDCWVAPLPVPEFQSDPSRPAGEVPFTALQPPGYRDKDWVEVAENVAQVLQEPRQQAAYGKAVSEMLARVSMPLSQHQFATSARYL